MAYWRSFNVAMLALPAASYTFVHLRPCFGRAFLYNFTAWQNLVYTVLFVAKAAMKSKFSSLVRTMYTSATSAWKVPVK